jgi:hypothetical protein
MVDAGDDVEYSPNRLSIITKLSKAVRLKSRRKYKRTPTFCCVRVECVLMALGEEG